MPPTTTANNFMALDVGDKRVGVAVANRIARLPRPLATLERGRNFWGQLRKLVADEAIDMLILGLPRNLEGQETAQSESIRQFAKELSEQIDLPVAFQDETLSSHQATTELNARGKSYAKGDVDALAATLILEDYLNSPAFTN